jgi:RsiW-degrading membrane proteinase PrsW (M82 family)
MGSDHIGTGHGIEDEPHLRRSPPPDDAGLDREPALRPGRTLPADPDDGIDQEPMHRRDDRPGPFADRFARADPRTAWLVAAAGVVLGGPLAVLTAFLAAGEHPALAILTVVVVAPLIEEIGKNLVAIWVCERSPWRLPGRTGIVLAAAGSGLGFAVIENLLYLHVYIADPSPALVRWRWSVCVALHVGCAVVAALGVARAWDEARRTGRRGRIETMAPLIIAAAAIHGTYNLIAIILEAVDLV